MTAPEPRSLRGAAAPAFMATRSILAAALAGAVFWMAAAWLYRGFATDDAFIDLRYARNLVVHGEASYNLGEPANGISSPLWLLVCAGGEWIAQTFDRPELALAIVRIAGGLFVWLAGILLVLLAARCLRGGPARALAISLFFLDPWISRWSFSGIGSALSLLLVTAGLLLVESRRDGTRWWGPFLLLPAGLLVQPALGLLGLILLARLLLEGCAPPRGRSLVAKLAVCIVPPVAWMAFAAATFETILPQGELALDGGAGSLQGIWYAVRILGVSQPVALGWIAIAAVVATVSGRGEGTGGSGIRARVIAGVAWIVLLPLASLVQGELPVSRDLLLLTPVLALLAGTAFEAVGDRRWFAPPRRGAFAAGSILLAAAISLAATATRILPGSSGGRERAYREIGAWLQQNSPPEATVAVREFGALGYYADRRIIDLTGGTLLRRDRRLLAEGGRPALIRAARPGFIVGRFPVPGLAYELALEVESVGPTAGRTSYTRFVVLYRPRWEADPVED